MKLYITAVSPSTATDYKGFTSYRWLNPDKGTSANSKREGMIAWLDQENTEAFVGGAEGEAEVKVVGTAPNRYLKTEGDGEGDNNLEQLPRF